MPYSNNSLIPKEEGKNSKKKKEFHSLTESELMHYPPCYWTKCFYVWYKDETVNLEELC